MPGRNRFQAEFVPREVGPHCIQASILDVEIVGSPFACEVYDISRVRVSKMLRGVVGKPYEFESKYAVKVTLEPYLKNTSELDHCQTRNYWL